MRKILIVWLLLALSGCENDSSKKMYVIGAGMDYDKQNTLYLCVIEEEKSEEEYQIIEVSGDSIQDMIEKLEYKYNCNIDFSNTIFLMSNNNDSKWIEVLTDKYKIELDCLFSLSDDLELIFNLESNTLIDDVMSLMDDKQTILNVFQNDINNEYLIECDGEDIYVNELERFIK